MNIQTQSYPQAVAAYVATVCGNHADALDWLENQILEHGTVEIHGAVDIVREAKKALRAIQEASENTSGAED